MSIDVTWHAFSEDRANKAWNTFLQFRVPQEISVQEQYQVFLTHCAQWKFNNGNSLADYVALQGGKIHRNTLEGALVQLDLLWGALSVVDIEDSKEDEEYVRALFVLFMPELDEDILDNVYRISTEQYVTLFDRIFYNAIYDAFDMLPEDMARKLGFHIDVPSDIDGIDSFSEGLVQFVQDVQPLMQDCKEHHGRLVVTWNGELDDQVLLQRTQEHFQALLRAFPFLKNFLEN